MVWNRVDLALRVSAETLYVVMIFRMTEKSKTARLEIHMRISRSRTTAVLNEQHFKQSALEVSKGGRDDLTTTSALPPNEGIASISP